MYRSTRSETKPVGAARAILEGLAPDGGLYVPLDLPHIPEHVLARGVLSYNDLAMLILSSFFPEFPEESLRAAIDRSVSRFSHPDVAPLVDRAGLRFLELFHGPTLAFKDLALTLMGGLSRLAMEAAGEMGEMVILVATSGDTGKAALSGFTDIPGTRIVVFFPAEGVSPIQRLQMVCHEAPNATVIGIKGSFDDAQRGVKAIFRSESVAARMARRNLRLTSANSINIARLLPQIVYYAKAWRDLREEALLGSDGVMDVAVPTGNFGNILAAWYAKRMGLPIGRFICASNSNKVLADFFGDYRYDRNRPFFATNSPSMDILVSSNLERLIFAATGDDPSRTADHMHSLAETGRFALDASESSAFKDFRGGWADDATAAQAIREIFEESGYLIDPHTAVAVSVVKALQEEGTKRKTGNPIVVAATASPFKFPAAVAQAIGMEAPIGRDASAELDLASRLADRAGLKLPGAISSLRGMPELHDRVVDPADMEEAFLAAIAR